MKIIIYEKSVIGYEISEIQDGGGTTLKLILPTPTDGMLKIGCLSEKAELGVCTIEIERLENGSYTPVVFTSSGTLKLEGFILHNGIIHRKDPDSEYIRALSEKLREASERIEILESELSRIKEKIEKTTIL